jgi:hypothetical protein
MHKQSLTNVQAWIREDEEEASTVIMIALHCKCGSGLAEEELEEEEEEPEQECESDDGSESKNELRKNAQAICKRRGGHDDEYIKFLAKFGPAMAGVAYWNKNKDSRKLSELLTFSDEAFIHLCMINYSKTWKAQEKRKSSEGEYIQVPVSEIH